MSIMRSSGCIAALLLAALCATAASAQTAERGAGPTDLGSMPSAVQFLPVPANASKEKAIDCGGRGIRSEPADLWRRDATAGRAARMLVDWGRRHYRFAGPPLCVDFDFTMRQWQATVGMPQTGVLTVADAERFQAELMKAQPAYQAASQAWTQRRVEMRKAGIDPNTGRPLSASEMPASPVPAAPVDTGPVGPPENQAFGLSLGAPVPSRISACRWSSWSGGLIRGADEPTCQHRSDYRGRAAGEHRLELERVRVSTFDVGRNGTSVLPFPNGPLEIHFSTQEQPGIATGSIKGILFEGRLEGIGFVPRDKQAIVEAFTSRYGPPVRLPIPMTNTEGASWTGWRYRFTRGDITATLNCVEFRSDDCSYAQILTRAGYAAIENLRKLDTQRGTAF